LRGKFGIALIPLFEKSNVCYNDFSITKIGLRDIVSLRGENLATTSAKIKHEQIIV